MTKDDGKKGVNLRPPSEGLKDLLRLQPHVRAGLVKAMAHHAISGSKNRMVQALGHELINAINDNDPMRFMQRVGLNFRGGVSIRASDKLDRRDRKLAWLARREPYCDLTPIKAAQKMFRDYENYRQRRWQRDLEEGRPPQAGADQVWHDMLFEEVPMPGTASYLLERIEKFNGVSGFPKK